jgi:hypothetical protein
MPDFDPSTYGPTIEGLLRHARLNPLDAGRTDASVQPLLWALSDETFKPKNVRDPRMAAACHAGLWLRFNYLDEAHRISQEIDTPEGSFWHGLVHRREGDFDNAKYWFRRVGTHPVYGPLCKAAGELAATSPEARPTTLAWRTTWDPIAFVDLCAAEVDGQTRQGTLCQEVQRREWELLFDYCWRRAVTVDN